MKNAEVLQFKRMLESYRDQSYERLNRLNDETRSLDQEARDSGDQSIATISKESLFQQNSQHRGQLRNIEAALARIEEGTFGICSTCNEDIAPRRLHAVPWTEHCLHCQELLEQELNSRDMRHVEDALWRQAG
jgi:DnaK suppressor protein